MNYLFNNFIVHLEIWLTEENNDEIDNSLNNIQK